MEKCLERGLNGFTELTLEEQQNVNGGGLFSDICKWVGGIAAGVGMVGATAGVVVGCFCPAVGIPIFAVGWVTYIGGMAILGMGGLIDMNDYEFGDPKV